MLRFLPILLVACALDDTDLDGDGYAVEDGDCDDLDASVGPDAEEVMDDGIDQDCDGGDLLRVVSGIGHRCMLDDRGWITCDGSNERGQLEVPDGADWTQLAAGAFHTCALDRIGSVTCWGDNRFGQASPPDLVGATSVDAVAWATTAEVDGTVVCWGLCSFR